MGKKISENAPESREINPKYKGLLLRMSVERFTDDLRKMVHLEITPNEFFDEFCRANREKVENQS